MYPSAMFPSSLHMFRTYPFMSFMIGVQWGTSNRQVQVHKCQVPQLGECTSGSSNQRKMEGKPFQDALLEFYVFQSKETQKWQP